MPIVRIRTGALAVAVAAAGWLSVGPTQAESAAPAMSASEVRPLLVGTKAPAVELRLPDGSGFDLQAAVAKAPTILIFYRGGW